MRYRLTVFHVFQAGLVSAGIQFIASIFITFVVLVLTRVNLIGSPAPQLDLATDNSVAQVTSFLTWAYFVTAIGTIFTNNRFVRMSAAYLQATSLLVKSSEPDHVIKSLVAPLWFSSIGFAVLALRPPEFVLEFDRYLGFVDVFPLEWSLAMTIGLAYFGANTRAALRAI